ncbi:MAG: efflux RND transporter periplasmic adaptor subunit [Proteobacteria bacterium]|nr:efflux RND transporter periplasmic adaptor subunit [Pseudomonadota bacterium]MBS0549281.1 efflux RND transporter periplasmic adaptor subunit [Pseudomonadota bacterium]
MIKRMLIMLVLVGAVLGGIYAFQNFVAGKIKTVMAGIGNMPQTVATTKATTSDWQPQMEAVGSLRAVSGADLSLELAGVVAEINFQSGDDVEAGKTLLRLRNDDDVAKLKSLQAQADLAQVNYDRDVKQLNAKAVSQAVVDTDEANLRNFRAQVDQQKEVVDKKVLKAPFAGRLGIRQVDLGQYLGAGTNIVTLQALSPIYVDFLLPQQSLEIAKVGQPIKVKVDTFPGKLFSGKVTSINSKVDQNTRNVQVRGTLDNTEHQLLPGMFATVDIDSGAPQKLITLPQTAITYNAYGSLVYIIDEKDKGPDGKPKLVARQTFVTTGSTRGDQVSVLKGVKEGDTVVIAGQMKLRNGVGVIVNNSVVPANDPNPKPADQ